jgi:hypothetical protein
VSAGDPLALFFPDFNWANRHIPVRLAGYEGPISR